MIGCVIPFRLPAAQDLLEIFDDRFGSSATIIASQLQFPIGTPGSQTPPLPMPSWIERFTMLITLLYWVNCKENCGGFRTMPRT